MVAVALIDYPTVVRSLLSFKYGLGCPGGRKVLAGKAQGVRRGDVPRRFHQREGTTTTTPPSDIHLLIKRID